MRNSYRDIYRTRFAKRDWHRPSPLVLVLVGLGAAILTAAGVLVSGLWRQPSSMPASAPQTVRGWAAPVLSLPAEERAALFRADYFYAPAAAARFSARLHGQPVQVTTTLQPDLQHRLLDLLRLHGPLLAAGVVLDAGTGAVLAMGNYIADTQALQLFGGTQRNFCLAADFPAASLIKIVSAAAVLEKKGFSPATTLPVSGGYHTLYKHQLGLSRLRYKPEAVSLEKAFSRSINPFFGLLGIKYLSDAAFAEIAGRLQFDHALAFDLPVECSHVFQPTTDFERAELTSGFNSRTRISPLHAALLAAMAVNDGTIMRPFLVEDITDESGSLLFQSELEVLDRPLADRTIGHLTHLMQTTVRSGTARRSFRRLLRKSLRSCTVGGKTGAIDLPESGRRCEWFAGYACRDDQRLAVGIVVVHGELRAVRPTYVAAEIFRQGLRSVVAAAAP